MTIQRWVNLHTEMCVVPASVMMVYCGPGTHFYVGAGHSYSDLSKLGSVSSDFDGL